MTVAGRLGREIAEPSLPRRGWSVRSVATPSAASRLATAARCRPSAGRWPCYRRGRWPPIPPMIRAAGTGSARSVGGSRCPDGAQVVGRRPRRRPSVGQSRRVAGAEGGDVVDPAVQRGRRSPPAMPTLADRRTIMSILTSCPGGTEQGVTPTGRAGPGGADHGGRTSWSTWLSRLMYRRPLPVVCGPGRSAEDPEGCRRRARRRIVVAARRGGTRPRTSRSCRSSRVRLRAESHRGRSPHRHRRAGRLLDERSERSCVDAT